MSTLEKERRDGLLVHPSAVHPVPDHVPAHVAAEHPDAASVVARRPERPISVRVVGRDERRSRAGLVLGLAACALLAAFVGGGDARSDTVEVRATTAPAATTVTSSAATAQCPPGSSVVAVCGPVCTPAPFSPFGVCRPASATE